MNNEARLSGRIRKYGFICAALGVALAVTGLGIASSDMQGDGNNRSLILAVFSLSGIFVGTFIVLSITSYIVALREKRTPAENTSLQKSRTINIELVNTQLLGSMIAVLAIYLFLVIFPMTDSSLGVFIPIFVFFIFLSAPLATLIVLIYDIFMFKDAPRRTRRIIVVTMLISILVSVWMTYAIINFFTE